MRQNLENFMDKIKWLPSFEEQKAETKEVDQLLSDISLIVPSIDIVL